MQSPTTTNRQEATTMQTANTLRVRQQFNSLGGPMVTVVQASYGPYADLESIIDGAAQPISATATSDGRHADTRRWHDGPEAEAVYVERYGLHGREFHGFVDSDSRRLIQAG